MESKNEIQFSRKSYKNLHLKEVFNGENLNEADSKEDKFLLESCFTYIYGSKSKMTMKKYKNKTFFILVGYNEVSMESKNTPFGMCSVSIDEADPDFNKLIVFDLFKTIQGLKTEVFVQIFLNKLQDFFKKEFYVYKTLNKQYFIKELVVYIDPSTTTSELKDTLNKSSFYSDGKMVKLSNSDLDNYEEYKLSFDNENLFNNSDGSKNNNTILHNNMTNNTSNASNNSSSQSTNNSKNNAAMSMVESNQNKANNSNRMEISMNNSQSNAKSNTSMVVDNEGIRSNSENENLYPKMNINSDSNSQSANKQSQVSALETIQETGEKINKSLSNGINKGLETLSNLFSSTSKQTETRNL